jgi:DNA-binding response OmpR family regulator
MSSSNYLNQGHITPINSTSASSRATSKKPLPEAKIRILLVDDDPRILSLLTTYLQQEGYKVATAKNGEEALQILDEFSPDVMCVDLMMPKIDGQELARQIRARRDLLYIPIVMLTAAGSQEATKVASLESGVDAFLAKPVRREELSATIRTMLRIKMAQDKMLEALERVADVQDELLEYERQQGHYEAMRATFSVITNEVARPLSQVNDLIKHLEKINQVAETGQYPVEKIAAASQACVQEVKDALAQVNQAIVRLNELSQVNPTPNRQKTKPTSFNK